MSEEDAPADAPPPNIPGQVMSHPERKTFIRLTTVAFGLFFLAFGIWAEVLLARYDIPSWMWQCTVGLLFLGGLFPLVYAGTKAALISHLAPKDFVETLKNLAAVAGMALAGIFAVLRFGFLETQIHGDFTLLHASSCEYDGNLRTGVTFGIRNTGNSGFSIKWSCIQIFDVVDSKLGIDPNDPTAAVVVKSAADFLAGASEAHKSVCRDSEEYVEPDEEASAHFVIFMNTHAFTHKDAPSGLDATDDISETIGIDDRILITRNLIFSERAARKVCGGTAGTLEDMQECLDKKGKEDIGYHGTGMWLSIMLLRVPDPVKKCGESRGRCFVPQTEKGHISTFEDVPKSVCETFSKDAVFVPNDPQTQ